MNQAEWYASYCDALLEYDPIKLRTRIQVAEIAIFSRIQDLVQDPIQATNERSSQTHCLLSVLCKETCSVTKTTGRLPSDVHDS
jgi:hypothetical protein